MVLAQKQIHRSVEQNRKSRNKSMLKWSTRRQDYTMGKIASSAKGIRQTGQLYVKNETRTFSQTVYKNKLKMD